MATEVPVPDGRGLGFRQPGQFRQTAVLVVLTSAPTSKPVLKEAKIPSKVGWQTFRHSFATILKAHGEDVRTVQEHVRQANSSMTLNLYAEALTDIKRTAQSKVARLVFSEKESEQT